MNVSYNSIIKARSAGLVVVSRCCSTNKSALFIPNRIRSNITPPIEPYLNIEKTLKPKMGDMEKSLLLRKKRNHTYDLNEMLKSAERLNYIELEEERLNKRKEEMTPLYSEKNDLELLDNLKQEGKAIKESLKELRTERWRIEESALIQYIRLPNYIDKRTPRDPEDEVIYSIGSKPEILHSKHVRSHQELCIEEINFSDNCPTCYYLMGDAAKLEVALCWAAQDFLLSMEFQMCSGPDFTRSSIVEGCNPDIDLFREVTEINEVFSLAPTSDFGDISTHAATHLVGSASFESLVGHYVKNVIINPKTSLPKTYFCCGKKYSPVQQNNDIPHSLYNVQQSSAVELISIAQTASSLDDQLHNIECAMKKFYESLGLHCIFVKRHSGNIKHAAISLKISILIYSPHGEKYVEVGSLNLFDDFVSKRLMTLYETDENIGDLYILNGTFMDVTKMVGCVIENCQAEGYELNDLILKENISAFMKKLSL